MRLDEHNARIIEGHRYMPVHVDRFKRYADMEADKIRRRGTSARVIKEHDKIGNKYYVYQRIGK
jgi:hypothetical protein